MPFSGPKWHICPEQKIFGTKHYYYFHLPIGPFQNLKKFLHWIKSYEDVPFLGTKWSICRKLFFWGKIIDIILIFLLAPFIAQNFKKIIPEDPEL